MHFFDLLFFPVAFSVFSVISVLNSIIIICNDDDNNHNNFFLFCFHNVSPISSFLSKMVCFQLLRNSNTIN